MKDLLEYILTNIVDHPDEVVIDEETEDDIIRFNVTCNEEDYPRVIGRKGMTIKSITDIIRVSKAKSDPDGYQKVYINIRS